MSDHDAPVLIEQRSSVKISQTAKGEPQVEVKRVAGEEPGLLEEAAAAAVAVWKQTVDEARKAVAA